MKFLVTGASGFIGSHVVSCLLKRGHEVIAIARNEEKAAKYPWYKKILFISQDLHAKDFTPSMAKLGNPDALIHLAWPGLPNYKDLFHFEENLPADYRFVKSLIEQGLKQVLVSGTCFEYGMQSGCLSENRITSPANPYALAKDTLHKCLQSLQQHMSFRLQWTRLFYMYGDGQSPNSLLAQLDRAIELGDRQFKMSGGEQLRDYLPVEIVASRIVLLAEQQQHQGVVNICSGQPISLRHLVEMHIQKRQADISLNLGFYPYPTYEPMAFWGNNNLYTSIIGIANESA